MNNLVSVVILTCGKNDYYLSCLKSILDQTHPFLELIFIDNSPRAAASQRARELCSSLKVHAAASNLFYCDGMNKGIKLGRGEFVLCLNDDVTLDAHFVEEALSGFARDPQIGMVSGKILRQDKQTLDSTGLFLSIWRTARERGYGQLDRGQFETDEYIFGVCGAVAFYRRKMLDEIRTGEDWFDSDFRIFYEDMDLSWRAHKHGWKGYYVPRALAYHVRGGTVRTDSGLGKVFARDYLSDELYNDLIKNRYLMILKNETLAGLFLHCIPIVLYDLCAWAHVIFFRPRAIRIFLSGLGCFSSAAKKRNSRDIYI